MRGRLQMSKSVNMLFERVCAFPNKRTFTIKPIEQLIKNEAHGGHHNDTIITIQVKRTGGLFDH